MATDDRDTDDENEERSGPDAGRSPETPGTYANAGREEDAQTRQQAWDAQDDVPGEPDAHRARSDRGQPERRYGMGRSGPDRSGTDQPSRPSQPSRRYGSKQQTGGQDEQIGSRNEQLDGQNNREDTQNEPPRRGDSRRSDESQQGGDSRRGGEPPQRRDPQQGEAPNRTEQTPPKRTQPLREPTEPETGDRAADEIPAERRSETGREGRSGRDEREAESEQQSDVAKYGGPRDPNWNRKRGQPGQSAERQRTQREYERRFDREQARQRDFQRDKSGGKYRRG